MSEIKTVLNFFDKNNGLDGIIKDLKAVKKLQAEINKQKTGVSSDNLKERTAALKEITRLQKQLDNQRKASVKTTKQSVGIEKQLVAVQEKDRQVKAKLKVARSEKFRQLQETNLALRNQNKLVKADIIENSKLSSVYERQSAKLNRLRKELKNLILTEGEGSRKTKKLALEVGKLDNKLKKADASAGQFQRNVGNYPKSLKRATGALRNFAGALGITAGIAGLVRVFGNAIKIAKDFEQSNANLAAVLGKTKEEIGTLTEDAKRLGAATAFSASQVSGLQTEFAKLGFNEQEILNATEATLSLAAATGSDLAEAAAITGATLGGFGLGAEETQRVVDVMAKSFSTSALDIEKFRESMKTAAPAARAVGVTVEETTALLGTMANAGISGSRAGSALAKTFIELNAKGLSLDEGLSKVIDSEDKLGTAVALVGKNAAKSFLVLAEGAAVTKELADGLRNAGGAAERMAREQLNTLDGRLKILNSAWEGFVLGLLSGDSAFSKISKTVVEFSTNLLGALTPAESLSSAWFKQRDELDKLEKEMNPLLDRYDELTEQTEITVEEQAELDGIIQSLAETIPLAVTGFDEYGVAMGIATDVGRDFLEQQKRILALRNAPAIKEEEDAIASLGREIEAATRGLKRNGKEWERETIVIGKNGNARTALEKITGKELLRIQDLVAANKISISDRQAIIAELKGEKSEREKLADTQKAAFELAQKEADALAAEIVTLNNLRAKLKDLRDIRGDIDTADKKALQTNKAEIKVIQDLIDKIEGKTRGSKKDKKATEELTEAEKALVAAMKEELAARKALEQQMELDAIMAAKELENKQEAANFQEDLSKFSKELQQSDFDTFVEFQESGFATFKEFEDAKRKELKETESAKKKADKEEEDRLKKKKEAQAEVIKQGKEAVDATLEEITKESEAKIKALDRQIDAEQNFLSENENLSAREIEFRRKKSAELEAERIEEQKRLERLAKTQAFFDLVAAFASSGDGEGAVGKAATTMAAAEVISGGFHDGGYTGDGNEHKEAGVVHKGEFVNTKKQTSEYGMKGWTAKDFDNAVSDGYFNQFTDSGMFADQNAKFLSVQNNQVGYDFARLENEMKSVKDAIGNIQSSDFSIQDGYFIKTKSSKGNTLITKKKLG